MSSELCLCHLHSQQVAGAARCSYGCTWSVAFNFLETGIYRRGVNLGIEFRLKESALRAQSCSGGVEEPQLSTQCLRRASAIQLSSSQPLQLSTVGADGALQATGTHLPGVRCKLLSRSAAK